MIAAVTTAVLSLDATVVLLTPVVLATAARCGVPARPHAYATAHLANTASLLLPVSNLTNLLAFSAAGLSFVHFTAGDDAAVAGGDGDRVRVFCAGFFRRDLACRPSPRGRARRAAEYRCSCSSCSA